MVNNSTNISKNRCRTLLAVFVFFFWSLYCLPVTLSLLIATLASSNIFKFYFHNQFWSNGDWLVRNHHNMSEATCVPTDEWGDMCNHWWVRRHVYPLMSEATCVPTDCCCSKRAPLRSVTKHVGLVQADTIIIIIIIIISLKCNMLSSWFSWNIDHVALNYNHSLTARYNYLVKVFVEFHILVYSSSTEYSV